MPCLYNVLAICGELDTIPGSPLSGAIVPMHTPSLAYSYVRFSTPEQSKGDSLLRQTEAAVEWCVEPTTGKHDTGTS